MAAPPGLLITCFGPPTVTVGGRAPKPDVLWTKHLALLIHLALAPNHRHRREHLMGLLWGESSQEGARRSLNGALHLLRKSLGRQRLMCDDKTVELNAAGLDVDALRVHALAERRPAEADELMRGDFLEGFNVDNAPGFEEWMSAARRDYDDLRSRLRVAAGREALGEGRYAVAADYARRALDHAPYGEPAIDLRMRALALAGDRTAALAAFHAFVERLARDVKESPSKPLLDLAERIRRGSLRLDVTPDTPLSAPLVGRAAAHRDAFDALTAGLTAGPRLIVVTGAPGMGRSRIVAECVASGILAGAHVARARQIESDLDARWSVLRQLLRGGLADAPGLAAAPPEALSALAGVAPELGARFPPRPVEDVAAVGAALAAVLQAVADEAPLLVAVDDGHWADGPSIAALHAALASLGHARIALVVTAATDVGMPPRELLQLQAAVGVETPGAAVRLDPLDADDMCGLVTALAPWCTDDTERRRRGRWLCAETGGSPLFAVTLLGALAKAPRWRDEWPPAGYTDIVRSPVSVPRPLDWAVRLRIRELSDADIAILRTAAVGTAGLDLDLMAALCGKPLADVEAILPSLERRHLVRYDGTRYVFVAPLIADVVRTECITLGELKRLERRALELLATRDDLEGRALRCELLARAQPDAAALDYIVATIRAARDQGAQRLARRAWVAGDKVATAGGIDRTELDRVRPGA